MLLVRLEIIATTYCSTIFKTHVFSLYSHLCIYIATHLHTVYQHWLKTVLEINSRWAWRWWSSEVRDTLWGRDRESFEMHLEVVIRCFWRYTWTPWSSKLAGCDRASMEIHMDAVMEGVCRCTSRLQSSELRDALWNRDKVNWRLTWRPWSCELAGHNRASLEIHLEAMMERVWRCTGRQWSSEIGRGVGGGQLAAHRVLRLYY